MDANSESRNGAEPRHRQTQGEASEDHPTADGTGQSELQGASLNVARAIEHVIGESGRRQERVATTVHHLRDRQEDMERSLQQLSQRHQEVSSSVSTILNNQKNGAQCYRELTSALSAIRQKQDELGRSLGEMDQRLTAVDQRAKVGTLVLGTLLGATVLLLSLLLLV